MSRASKCDAVVFLNRTTKLFVESFHDVSGIYMLTHPFSPKKRTEGGGKRGGKGKEEKKKTRILTALTPRTSSW
jgi:hypothetical protein